MNLYGIGAATIGKNTHEGRVVVSSTVTNTDNPSCSEDLKEFSFAQDFDNRDPNALASTFIQFSKIIVDLVEMQEKSHKDYSDGLGVPKVQLCTGTDGSGFNLTDKLKESVPQLCRIKPCLTSLVALAKAYSKVTHISGVYNPHVSDETLQQQKENIPHKANDLLKKIKKDLDGNPSVANREKIINALVTYAKSDGANNAGRVSRFIYLAPPFKNFNETLQAQYPYYTYRSWDPRIMAAYIEGLTKEADVKYPIVIKEFNDKKGAPLTDVTRAMKLGEIAVRRGEIVREELQLENNSKEQDKLQKSLDMLAKAASKMLTEINQSPGDSTD